MRASPVVEVLIATIDGNIQDAINVPLDSPIPGVAYLIAWQQTTQQQPPIPESINRRNDIRILSHQSKGLSKNRNFALDHAIGQLLVIADDDSRFIRENFNTIIEAFKRNSKADIITFKAKNEFGLPIKDYSPFPYTYPNQPKGAYISSCEIVLRNHPLLPRFDLRLGLGAPVCHCGEEEVFIHEAYQKGFTIVYEPSYIVQTISGTTGSLFFTSPGVRRAKGAVLAFRYGIFSAILRGLKCAWSQKQLPAKVVMSDIISGIRCIKSAPHHQPTLPHPLISVIIPVYNREWSLERLFCSLRKIHWRPLEIIFVDNDSTDASLTLCRDFAHHSSGTNVIITSESQQGACYARNKGASLANGDYLYFFDSDDEISPTFFDEAIKELRKYPLTDIIATPTNIFLPTGKIKHRTYLKSKQVADHIISASLSTQSILMSRRVYEKAGGWNVSLKRWNDWELGVRLLCEQPKMRWLSSHHHLIYQHEQSITGSSFAKDFSALTESIESVEKTIRSAGQLSKKEKTKALQALAAKALLLAALLHREGAEEAARQTWHYSRLLMRSRLFQHISPLIYFYAKNGGKGGWKLLHFFL